MIKAANSKEIYARDLQKGPTDQGDVCRQRETRHFIIQVAHIKDRFTTNKTYRRNRQKRQLPQKRLTKKDPQKRLTKETHKRDPPKRPTKETYKRDQQKRPTKKDQQMRHTKKTHKRDQTQRPTKKTDARDLQKRPLTKAVPASNVSPAFL